MNETSLSLTVSLNAEAKSKRKREKKRTIRNLFDIPIKSGKREIFHHQIFMLTLNNAHDDVSIGKYVKQLTFLLPFLLLF